MVKPIQNKKGQNNLGDPRKNSLFPYKRTAFFSGTPNFFGSSYFEVALIETKLNQFSKFLLIVYETNKRNGFS